MTVNGALRLVSRRDFLKGTAGMMAVASCPAVIGRASAGLASWSSGDPFSLGVAAGDPSPDGFVIWTRLAPDPLSADPQAPGGVSGPDIPLKYEIAKDSAFKDVVRSGEATAEANYAYSVHVELSGLEPGRPYWYRFASGSAQSRTGRAMTAPVPGAPLDKLRFGFVSCSNWEHGYFSAYRHLADEQPDFVAFLGDYIYEYAETRRPTVRKHSDGVEAVDLRTYRNRYAQYRTDPDLQRLHAEVPALMTWDDHEVENDYADSWSCESYTNPADFLKRRAAAYQAFYEHMPLRPSLSKPEGPNMRVYDRFTFGDLAQFSVIDGRQYRSKPACYDAEKRKGRGHLESNASCPERLDAQRSMIGVAQEAWLFDGLATSKARWNVIAQDVLMAELRQKLPAGDIGYWTDDWNGFPASRQRLLNRIHDANVQNAVVLTGDIHSFFQNDLKLDFANPASPTVATEFVGTSITSPSAPYEYFKKYLPDNPHVKFFDNRVRGYVSMELGKDRCLARYQAISDVKDANATVSTLKTFAVENGKPGAVEA